MIRILYFARLREAVGTAGEDLALDGMVCVGDLLARLRQRQRGGVWSEALSASQRVLMAVNQQMARPETPLAEGDEVGLFPPVTGADCP